MQAEVVNARGLTGNAPLLAIRGLRKSFGSVEVLKGIDVEVNEGEVIAIIGPSGSGKSTLARCINQLETIQGGAIFIDGVMQGFGRHRNRLVPYGERKRAVQRRKVGMVFQAFNLFPHRTALGNVVEGLVHALGVSKEEARERGIELLTKVGLPDKIDAYPGQLSGGQQQRVAIARALAPRPRLVIFDEPTSALDPELVDEVLSVMRELAKLHQTMVVVTHEIAFARQVADRVIFMDQGVIVEQGPAAQVIDAPKSERLRTFLTRFKSA